MVAAAEADGAEQAPFASSPNHLFLKHVDMLQSHSFLSLLAQTSPLSSNSENAKKMPEEILNKLLSLDKVKQPSNGATESDHIAKELAEDGLGFLLPRKSDQLATLDLEGLCLPKYCQDSSNKRQAEENCRQDVDFLHESTQSELAMAQAMKVLSKAIYNFETSTRKYLNGQMTAEELARHEQNQNIEMQGEAGSMFDP